MTCARLLALAVIVCAVIGGSAPLTLAAQSTEDGARTWREWAEAARAHVPGQFDAPARSVAFWSREELLQAVESVPRQEVTSDPSILGRALVLHADIAILNRTPDGYRLPEGSRVSVLFADGRAVSRMAGTYHWEVARAIVNAMPRGDDRLHAGRLFYRAAGAALQFWGENVELQQHLAQGRRVLDDDPVLLLYEGTMRQAFASPRFQQYLSTRTATESRPSLAPPGTLGGIQIDSRVVVVPRPSPTAPAELGRAEELFRRALERDSGLVEARLRLAHVLGDRGRHKEAREQLLQATRAPLPRLLDYYGSLLLGREEQAAGNGDAARRAFERAAALFPSAKSPRIALSHLALMRGDRQEAVTVLAPAGGATPMADEDPWDVIHRLHDPFAHELIARFRQELAR